MRIPPLGSRA